MKLLNRGALLIFISVFSVAVYAQRYTETADPKNSARRIITLEEVKKRATTPSDLSKNLLDAESKYKRREIAFQPFEMVNPETNKPINPNARLTLNLPNGQKVNFTAKEYFDQLNALERELNKRGRSLRNPDAFEGLRVPPVNTVSKNVKPVLPSGFQTESFQFLKPIDNSRNANAPVVFNTNPLNKQSGTIGKLAMEWSSGLLVAKNSVDHGTVDFPAEWVQNSIGTPGRKKFPLLVKVPKGMEGIIKKAVWQVSEKPFDNISKEYSKGIKLSGTSTSLNWVQSPRGMVGTPHYQKYMYTSLYADLATIPEPTDKVVSYYARALLYNASGELVNVTSNVMLAYGSYIPVLTMTVPEFNSVPGFNYSFPSDKNIPFGLFVKGEGLRSSKITEMVTKGNQKISEKKVGYKVSADAGIGVRYYNFANLVDKSQPLSKELTLISGKFAAVSGTKTGTSMQNEANGVNLSVEVLNGAYKHNIPFTKTIPGTNSISLNYTIKQNVEMELINSRFFIGPIPIKIYAALHGEEGLEMNGSADLQNGSVSGSIVPYAKTMFSASGGVDAIIAYATLDAKVDPLIGLEMPMGFNSEEAKGINFQAKLTALRGKIFLNVGFYYPCPDLKKIVGWITGDEKVPLCECNWQFPIFNFDGIEHTWSY